MKDIPSMIRQVIQTRQEKWNEAKALQTRGNLSDTENRHFDELVAEIEALDARADELHQLNMENQRMDQQSAKYADVIRRDVAAYAGHTDTRAKEQAQEIEAMFRGEIRGVDIDFDARALTVGSTTAGGNLVPQDFSSQIVDAIRHEADPFLTAPNARIFNTSDGNDLLVPTVSSHGTASQVAEAGTITQADPAFGQVELGAWKIGQLIKASSEILADQRVGLPQFLAQELGRAVGYRLANYLAVGTGTTEHEGAVWSAGTGVSGTATAGIQADEIVDMYYSLNPSLRARGIWVASDTQAKAIRKLVDGNQRFMLDVNAGLEYGAPAQLLGRPFYVSPHMAAAGSGNASLMFYDPSYFGIRVTNLRVERSDDAFFSTDEVGWRCLLRSDSKALATDFGKVYVGT